MIIPTAIFSVSIISKVQTQEKSTWLSRVCYTKEHKEMSKPNIISSVLQTLIESLKPGMQKIDFYWKLIFFQGWINKNYMHKD